MSDKTKDIKQIQKKKRPGTGTSSKFSFFELAPVSCCMISKGIVVKANKAAVSMLGFDADHIEIQSVYGYIAKEFHTAFRKQCSKLFRSGGIQKNELRMIKNNGEEIWVRVELSLADSHDPLILAVLVDITEHKRLEDLLSFTQYAVENSADSTLWLTRDGGKIVYANKTACEMLGYTEEEIYSLSIFDIDHNLPPFTWEDNFDILKKEKSLHFETVHKTKSGRLIPVEVTANYIEFKDKEYNCAFIKDISKFKDAEITFQQREREFYILVENVTDLIIRFDTKFQIIYANSAAKRVLNATESELIGKTPFDINMPRRESSLINQALMVVSEKGIENEVELTINTPSGLKYFLARVVPEKGIGGEISSLLAVMRDITERKLYEQALRDSEDRFRTIFEEAHLGIVITSPSFIFEKVNPAFCRIMGYSSEELNKMTFKDITHPDFLKKDIENVNKVGSGDLSFYQTEKKYIHKSGKEIWGNIIVSSIRDENGKLLYFLSMVNDITDRKQAENELQNYRERLEEIVKERTERLEKINLDLQSEITMRMEIEKELAEERNVLKTLIDNLPDQIYAKDRKSRFTMANAIVIKYFNRGSLEEVLGKTDFDFLPNEKAEVYYSQEQALMNSGDGMISNEEPAIDEEGKTHWFSINKIPLKDRQNNVIGLVGINREITAFKNAEVHLQKARDDAEAANKAKSAFLSNMSHEIRTPLNSILGFSQLMMYAENLNAEQKEWLDTINKSGEHLLALINDVLEISKIEAGRAMFSPSGVDLHSILNDLEAMIKPRADEKKLTFLIEPSPDLPKFIITDEIKLKQIFINILGNAVKFTNEGGVALRIRAVKENDGQNILISEIEDTGPGIAHDEMNSLFQMFWQSNKNMSEGGTGLGLVISQQYAKIMGGEITARSEMGKGSCFTIRIKIDIDDEFSGKPEISRKRVIGLQPGQPDYKILIADDRKENRVLLKKILTDVGFGVIEAVDGKEAFEKFNKSLPDIILMDMRMPVMDGYEATRKIKEIDKKNTPIIAVTASAFYEDRQKIMDTGVNAYLRKPFKEYEIFNAIQAFLDVKYIYEDKG